MIILTSLLLAAAAAPVQDMVGVSWAGSAYAIDSATGTGAPLGGGTGYSSLNSMAKSPSGTLYSMAGYGGPNALITINPTTGAGTLVAMTTLTSVRGMAFDGAGTLYVANDSSGTGIGIDDIYTVNTSTGVATLIGSTGYFGVQGMAYANGKLYVWESGSGSGFGAGLMIVNTANGSVTDVDAGVGGSGYEVQTLCASPAGVLYGARDALYTVSAVNGATSLVGSGGYADIRGIEFKGGGSGGPTLTKTGSCPGATTMMVGGATPSSSVAMLYGFAGSFTYGGSPCTGITVDISAPTLAGILTANGSGNASISFNAPAGLCGRTVQAVDIATCTKTNTVTL